MMETTALRRQLENPIGFFSSCLPNMGDIGRHLGDILQLSPSFFAWLNKPTPAMTPCRNGGSSMQIQILSTVNRVARWNRCSPPARSLRSKPGREHYDDDRQGKNEREPKA